MAKADSVTLATESRTPTKLRSENADRGATMTTEGTKALQDRPDATCVQLAAAHPAVR